jgi:transposase
MYLKCHKRFKDGKEHRYWSIVESVRRRRGVRKRHLLYLVEINLPEPRQAVTPKTFTFSLNRQKLRQARRGEGTYLLRTNLTEDKPEDLWKQYIVLTEVEQAFKEIKQDLGIRPVYHQKDDRIEAHIFVSFLAYCLQVTLKQRARAKAPV